MFAINRESEEDGRVSWEIARIAPSSRFADWFELTHRTTDPADIYPPAQLGDSDALRVLRIAQDAKPRTATPT